MRTLMTELRQTIRGLRRRPVLAGTCMLVVALAVGTNGLLFTIVHAVLLTPPAYPDYQQIVTIEQRKQEHPSQRRGFADEAALDVMENIHSLDDIVVMRSQTRVLDASGRLHRLSAALVNGGVLTLFGYTPVLGRQFNPDEPGAVLIAHHVWQEQFSGNPDILNQSIRLDGELHTITGVLPPDFSLPRWGRFDLLAPYQLSHERSGRPFNPVLNIYARMKKGVTISQLQSEMDALAESLRSRVIDQDRDRFFKVVSIAEHQIFPEIRQYLLLLQAAGLLVLLLCLSNAAHLVLNISGSRTQDVAIRLSLGITRGRLFGHLLLEVSLLVLGGTLLGIVLALAGLGPVVATLPGRIATLGAFQFGPMVLVLVLSLGGLIALVCTVAPFLRWNRLESMQALRSGASSQLGSSGWQRPGFLSLQLALAVVICTGAALMLETMGELNRVDLGTDTENLVTASLALPSYLYGPDRPGYPVYQRVLESVATLPGVESAAITTYYPGEFGGLFYPYETEDSSPNPTEPRLVRLNSVSSALPAVLDLSLIDGRFIQPADTQDAPRVVVMNETFAREAFGDVRPVGRRIRLLRDWYTIAGIVGDYHNSGLRRERGPEAFVSFLQESRNWGSLLVRTRNDATYQRLPIERAIEAASTELSLGRVETVNHLLDESMGSETLLTRLLTFFAVIALLIAAAGTFGLSANWVRSRTREIGIRQALGATRRQVVEMVLLQGVRGSVVGIGLGIGLALALSRFLESYLFGVNPTSPPLLAGVALGLLLLVGSSTLVPARWAAGIDPATTLRSE